MRWTCGDGSGAAGAVHADAHPAAALR